MTPRERLFALEQFGIKLGLDNITTLVEALGRPDRACPTVHVAGTNGKGSVTAMVERGLRAAGHRTGRYTSPHLFEIEERFVIDGAPIDRAALDAITSDVLALVDRLRETGALPHPPTFFEATTAIAFEAFRRANVSAAVIEVGLGGRFDATNVISPAVTAITSIALDHEQHLGTTLQQIAFEKAGIIKPGVPVVVGVVPPEAQAVIDEVAHSRGAPVVSTRPAGQGIPVTLGLQGAHQRDNAAVAVEVLRLCNGLGRLVRDDHLVSALADVEWPARLEWLRVPSLGDVLLDAAHNPAGAEALADYVVANAGRLPMVVGVMRDKDVHAIARALSPGVERFVATNVASPRALHARELAGQIRAAVPSATVDWREDPESALREAMRGTGRAIVAGSIFLVGPFRARLLGLGAAPVRYPSKASPFYLN